MANFWFSCRDEIVNELFCLHYFDQDRVTIIQQKNISFSFYSIFDDYYRSELPHELSNHFQICRYNDSLGFGRHFTFIDCDEIGKCGIERNQIKKRLKRKRYETMRNKTEKPNKKNEMKIICCALFINLFIIKTYHKLENDITEKKANNCKIGSAMCAYHLR